MSHFDQDLLDAFPNDTVLMHRLMAENAHFRTLAERFAGVDTEVEQVASGENPASDERLEGMKKNRLAVLDEIAIMVAAAKLEDAQ